MLETSELLDLTPYCAAAMMPGDHPNIPTHPILPLPDQSGYYMQHGRTASAVVNGKFGPLHNVDIRTSDTFPKKIVVFDRTHDRIQIMFHPNLSAQLFHPGYDVVASIFQNNLDVKYLNNEIDNMSALKEDSDDIDALLSAECDEYDDNYDDDMVSTARTEAVYRCDSPDSCSNYESLSMKSRAHLLKSSESRCNGKKHHRTRKMLNTFKGIVPGANHLSTAAVLDEAVRYLKELRVEVQQLGTGSSEG